ncbi:LuxR C-terminal-related transcriptional regulator [Clostridium boliviensis]|uniref:LuxR C-terminal-related transcriptional regulator n=1 Tax=Clostridium boliviensis TaxID=318465 RepID=A0ABU4GX43_9CLOT|nr:LuxR C-terminal-related transcriptional regulator [Clostridium boliviensis]MDW2800772.1 LuxR C-terminal-related transcriptional regulator [Clostridium boliviensis]
MEHSSDILLLTTKLKIPAPRKNYIVRHGLFEQLSKCRDMGIIFLSGGAGTGKTTLLSSFIHEKKLKNVCWLSLDLANTNVYSFWHYFTASVSPFLQDEGKLLDLMRTNPDTKYMENLLITLINRLWGEEEYYMVLDDVHYICDEALIRTFDFFIESMPSNFHFFMLSREDPPVYLGPMAVSGRLLFIDGKQLQLTKEEGIAFLKDTMKLADSDEELNQLNHYAEGWIGGLQLAAAAKAAGKYSGQLLRAGGGIASQYLTREIIDALTEKEQDFLIKTGYLSYFDADICNRLFMGFTKPDFDQMMERFMEKNLFLICLDEQNGIYRYHNILSEYLKQQFLCLSEEQKAECYRITAGAFEEKGDYEEALREYCEAGNYKEVLRLAKSMEGRIEAWNYLDQVPIELLFQDTDLAAQCFIYNLGNLNMERCHVIYEKFKELYEDSDLFSIVDFAQIYFTNENGILPQYPALTDKQIEQVPYGPVVKAVLLIENAGALLEKMLYEEAENCIIKGIKIAAGLNPFIGFFAYNQLGQVYEEMGRLNDSFSCYAKSKEVLKPISGLMGIETNYYFGLAGVYMRRMELEQAEIELEYSKRLLEERHIHVDITDMTLAYHLAEMKFLHGDNDTAVSYVDGILSEYPNYSVLTLGRLLYELACIDRLPESLSDKILKELDATNKYSQQPLMKLLRGRILFKFGNTAEALKETEEILTSSRLKHNKLRLVEADILKIYMFLHMPVKATSQREINNLLVEAVHYAQEDRILMPFYLDRDTLLPMLNEMYQKSAGNQLLSGAETAFLGECIVICGGQTVKESKPELLSAREYEVLNQLALGITNREIAENLCISQATVKTHVLSIFSKLGVSSRMLAVEKARKEGLI